MTTEQRYPYSNKSYCKKCYDFKVKEREQYNVLIKTICECFNIEKPTGLILKQIKDYKDKFNYIYSGMTYCLWYLKEILNSSFDVKYGIAIIKYQYENAKHYFESQQKINESVSHFEIKEVVKKVKLSRNKPKQFIINLDDLKENQKI